MCALQIGIVIIIRTRRNLKIDAGKPSVGRTMYQWARSINADVCARDTVLSHAV